MVDVGSHTVCWFCLCPCRTQAARDWTHRTMVGEGEAVFGHVCHDERRPELVPLHRCRRCLWFVSLFFIFYSTSSGSPSVEPSNPLRSLDDHRTGFPRRYGTGADRSFDRRHFSVRSPYSSRPFFFTALRLPIFRAPGSHRVSKVSANSTRSLTR